MITMSDMNTLLLTFFVMLISMMTLEKPHMERLTEVLSIAGRSFKPTEGKTKNPSISKQPDSTKLSESMSTTTDVIDINGVNITVTKTTAGFKYTFTSSEFAFPEGEWELSKEQQTALEQFANFIYGTTSILYAYGYCDKSWKDSVVIDQSGIISAAKSNESNTELLKTKSDKELLSILRATSVQKYLSNPKRDNYIREDSIIPIAAADKNALFPNPISDEERVKNRRIEILVSEMKSK